MKLTARVATKYLPASGSGAISQVAERARQTASAELSLSAGTFNGEYLLQLHESIGKYLKRANTVSKSFEKQWKKVQNMRIEDFTKRAQQSYKNKDNDKAKQKYLHALKKYQAGKQAITKKTADILKEGYVLIDYIRESVTGIETIYRVGFEKDTLYTGTLSLEQILKMSYVDIQWEGFGASAFKLRLHADIHDTSLQRSIRQNESADYLQYIHRIIKMNNVTVNAGNLFETFISLSRRGYPKDETIIKNTFKEVQSNTVSFVKGGDIDNESIEFFDSDPSLVSLSTIIKALTQLQALLQTAKNVEQLKNGLEILFTKEGAQKFKNGKFQEKLDKEMKKLYAQLAQI